MFQEELLYFLECPVQYYDWGNTNYAGIIRSLRRMDSDMEPGKPHAELWMGAHPSAPSRLISCNIHLDAAIEQFPEYMLGKELFQRGVRKLPFLFKILDAARPLSIQAHPDKHLAEQLHSENPKKYPDNNHKPELAVCIRNMRALAGFRPRAEIQKFLKEINALNILCAPEELDEGDLVRSGWSRLMTSDPEIIRKAVLLFKDTYYRSKRIEEKLVFELIEYYGDSDAGVFCPYFLNLVCPAEGEGLYLGPNEPHAYLGGEMLECMASSDNVIRAGLTGKFRDIPTLLSMLHYKDGYPILLTPEKIDKVKSFYNTPVSDFVLSRYDVLPENSVFLSQESLPGILLVSEGSIVFRVKGISKEFRADRGDVIFFPGGLKDKEFQISIQNPENANAVYFIASVGLNFGLDG